MTDKDAEKLLAEAKFRSVYGLSSAEFEQQYPNAAKHSMQRFTEEFATILAASPQLRSALELGIALLTEPVPQSVERCTTHHGCECREWAAQRVWKARLDRG